jgi:hypothetical protein
MLVNAALSKAAGADAAKSNVFANAAQAASGAMASAAEIPYVGWILAPLAGAAIYAAALAFPIPSAAGGFVLPDDMLVQAHANEMILPAHLSQGFQSLVAQGAGGGGGDTHHHWNVNVPSLDAKSVEQFFSTPRGRNIMTSGLMSAYRRGTKGTRR